MPDGPFSTVSLFSKNEADACKDRIDYLTSLNILLEHAIKDLGSDLGEL